MVVPLILGKMAMDISGGQIDFQSAQMVPLSAGFLAAFICGLVACTWMIKLVRQSKLQYFAIYCFLVGLIAIAVGLWN
jgi:undecaprenyl-diphosphatase